MPNILLEGNINQILKISDYDEEVFFCHTIILAITGNEPIYISDDETYFYNNKIDSWKSSMEMEKLPFELEEIKIKYPIIYYMIHSKSPFTDDLIYLLNKGKTFYFYHLFELLKL